MTSYTRYTGPSADDIGHGLTRMGFPAHKQGNIWKVSTAICHPDQGGQKLNLKIEDGRQALLVKCFSELCPPAHILDCLENLGFAVRQFANGRHAPVNAAVRPAPPLTPPRPPRHALPRPDDFPFTPEQELITIGQVARALGSPDSQQPYRADCPNCGHQLTLWREGNGNGMRARCQGDCAYTRIISSITARGWALKRTYFYPLQDRRILRRVRWDHPKGKTYRGPGMVANPTLKFWHADQPQNVVVIVEGEKAAEALASADLPAPGYTVASWPNGTATAALLNLDNCAERDLLLWPDDDTPGRKAMLAIAGLAAATGAASIRMVSNGGESETDAADYPPSLHLRILNAAKAWSSNA